jgi:isopentenyldiphosphate isomerase
MPDEFVDVYDENLRPVGVLPRAEVHATGSWHRSIHCWVVRSVPPGSILFQKRHPGQEMFPNRWDVTAAGHYRAGERVEDALREIREELGRTVALEELHPLGIKIDVAAVDGMVNREFCDVFLYRCAAAAADYRLDAAEVAGLAEMTIDDGLLLFSGRRPSVPVRGIEWDEAARGWRPIERDLALAEFTPRIDPYYLRVCIMARALLRGEPYLAV